MWMHLLRQTNKKSDDENKSNEQQSFVTQTVPNWPKYLVVKSTDETVCK